MSEKQSLKINLFDYAMSIDGPEPIEISVGDVDITLRRSHTGKQVAEWDKLERDLIEKNKTILLSDISTEQKNKKVLANQRTYIPELLRTLSVEGTSDDVISRAAEQIAALPTESRSRTLQSVAIIAGVLSEDGKTIPFGSSSKTTSGTKS